MKKSRDILLNKKNNNWLKFLIGFFVLIIFIIILNFFNAPVRNFFYIISSPIEKTFWTAGESSSNFFSSFLNAGAFSKENENLKKENQKLLSQISILQAIKNANEAQSNVSLACQNSGFNLLMAGVVGLDDEDMLSINKGSADGVEVGMPVIDKQSVLFGKVAKVYKNFSEIMLISNKNSVINAKVQQNDPASPVASAQGFIEPKEIDGVIRGSGKLGFYLDLIPIDSAINQNDILLTSSLEKVFPKDLLIGRITKIEKNDQNPYQKAQVEPFFDIKTDNLFVITNYKQK